MLFESSYIGEAFPSSAFVNFFHASGIDSAACATVPGDVWNDLQPLTTELLQRVFHLLGCLRVRKGEEDQSFDSSCFQHLQSKKQKLVACQVNRHAGVVLACFARLPAPSLG